MTTGILCSFISQDLYQLNTKLLFGLSFMSMSLTPSYVILGKTRTEGGSILHGVIFSYKCCKTCAVKFSINLTNSD